MRFLWLLTCISAINANSVFSVPQRNRANGRIVGGWKTYPAQFPYAVALYSQTSSTKNFCTGTLISNRWILTAGQCVYGAVSFQVLLGSIHLQQDDPGRVELATSTYFLHPDYNPSTLENDIGLIVLNETLNITQQLGPVDRLPQYEIPDAATVSMFGWGQVSDEDTELSEQLKWVIGDTIPNDECRAIYGNQILDTMICIAPSYSNYGTCFGDIGSAMIYYDSSMYAVPAGVASFLSFNGCDSTDPSGFTRVYPYNDWIRNVTKLKI